MQASLNQMNSCNCGVFFAANNLEAHANGKNEKCAGTQHGKAQTSWQVQYIVRVSFFRFPQWHCCGAVLNLDSFCGRDVFALGAASKLQRTLSGRQSQAMSLTSGSIAVPTAFFHLLLTASQNVSKCLQKLEEQF
jgi:hypothetical protein